MGYDLFLNLFKSCWFLQLFIQKYKLLGDPSCTFWCKCDRCFSLCLLPKQNSIVHSEAAQWVKLTDFSNFISYFSPSIRSYSPSLIQWLPQMDDVVSNLVMILNQLFNTITKQYALANVMLLSLLSQFSYVLIVYIMISTVHFL